MKTLFIFTNFLFLFSYFSVTSATYNKKSHALIQPALIPNCIINSDEYEEIKRTFTTAQGKTISAVYFPIGTPFSVQEYEHELEITILNERPALVGYIAYIAEERSRTYQQ